jgi:O-antigen ligase
MALLLVALPQYWKRLETIGASAQVFDSSGETSAGQAEADGAVRRRVTEMLAAVRVFLDHPVVGVGPGLFKSYAEEYGNEGGLRRIEGGRRAHSLYLEIAAETGVFGLALFLAAIAATLAGLAAARRVCRVSDPELAELATAYLLALVCYLSTGIFLHLAYMRYFYLVLALGGAVAQVALHPKPAPAPATTDTGSAGSLVSSGGAV